MIKKINVLKLRPSAILPSKQSEFATGYDLYACLDNNSMTIGMMPELVPTGIALSIPKGFDVQIRPRSGLTAKGLMSGYGTIDADYRGELFVTLYCIPFLKQYKIQNNERIAQLVFSQSVAFKWNQVNSLDNTNRGKKGHGSTGKK
ncbi:MAG: dUTP diphosphatase [Dehalococcoidia bacterium]|jgi:dUTP pyrophosphatase|nr:dUTP diphosphatase [Dehalococcoidia bacterium]|tara:strand:+ start:434 stop:871 length:438 start_codon:yes stop_codon:yes gene_type:complete